MSTEEWEPLSPSPADCEGGTPPGPNGCTTIENCVDENGDPVPIIVTLDIGDPDGDGIINVEIDGDVIVPKFATYQGEVCTPEGTATVVFCIDQGVTTLVGYIGPDGVLVPDVLPPEVIPCTSAVETALDCAVVEGDPCDPDVDTAECFIETRDQCVADKLDVLIEGLIGDCGGENGVCNCSLVYVAYDPEIHEADDVVGDGSEEFPFQIPLPCCELWTYVAFDPDVHTPGSGPAGTGTTDDPFQIPLPGPGSDDCCVYEFDEDSTYADGDNPSGSGTADDPFLLPLPEPPCSLADLAAAYVSGPPCANPLETPCTPSTLVSNYTPGPECP